MNLNRIKLFIKNLCDKPYAFPVTLLAIFLYRALLATRSFDLTDSGFVITFYKYIFTDPSCCEYNFLYYFSGIIGGLFNIIYPEGGLFYYRMAGIVIDILSIWVAWMIIGRYTISKYYVISGAILYTVFYSEILPLHHNSLSYLFAFISILFLIRGVTSGKAGYIFISGFVIGINTFIRLPNIILVVLAGVILADSYFRRCSVKRILLFLSVFFSAVFIGILSVVLLMFVLGHERIMLSSLMTAFSVSSSGSSTHNIMSICFVLLGFYKSVFLYLGIIISCWFALSLFKRKSYIYISSVVLFLFFLLFACLRDGSQYIYIRLSPVYYALTLFATLFILIDRRVKYKLKLIVLTNLLLIVFNPLGSDLYVNYSPLLLSFPIIIYFADMVAEGDVKLLFGCSRINLRGGYLSGILYGILLFLMAYSLYYTRKRGYEDSGNIESKSYPVKGKYTRCVYTTKDKAAYLNHLMDNISDYVKDGDELLSYYDFPAINYMTNTKPYIASSWVKCFPGNESLEYQLSRSEKSKSKLPVVLLQKQHIGIPILSDDIPFYMENWPAMRAFLYRHDYGIEWESEYFAVLTPDNVNPVSFEFKGEFD